MVTVFYSALARSLQLTHQGIPVPDKDPEGWCSYSPAVSLVMLGLARSSSPHPDSTGSLHPLHPYPAKKYNTSSLFIFMRV